MTTQAVATQTEARRSVPAYAGVDMSNTGSGGSLAPKNLGDVVAFATIMARADIALPKHLRGNEGACLAVSMQAMRWEMDPFAVANKSYSVSDRLAYEAQLVAAVVHTRAPIKRRPDYAYDGAGPTRRCIVSVEMLDGTTKVYESPTFASITTKNSPLWKSDPDQQLGYFAIRSWARRHAPEVILGVYTPDELIDNPDAVRNVTAAPPVGLTAPPVGLTARLAQSAPAAEGFNANHAPPVQHDADGVVDEAEDIQDAIIEDSPSADHAPAVEPKKPSKVRIGTVELPTLADHVTAFKTACQGKSTTALSNIWRSANVAALRTALDAADPDVTGETSETLELWFNDTFTAQEDVEKGGAQ